MNQKSEVKPTGDEQGIVSVGLESAALAAEKVLQAWFGFWRDVRGEVAQRAGGLIDWVDTAQQGTTRLARSAVQRTDDVANTWLDTGERLTVGIVRTLRSTGHSTSQFASNTAASLTRPRREKPVAQA